MLLDAIELALEELAEFLDEQDEVTVWQQLTFEARRDFTRTSLDDESEDETAR